MCMHAPACVRARPTAWCNRLLAFLREEEERERLEEIERLRPVGTAVGPFMEYRCAQSVACDQHACQPS